MKTYYKRRVRVIGKEIRRNVIVKNGVAFVRYERKIVPVTCTSTHQDNPHALWTVAYSYNYDFTGGN